MIPYPRSDVQRRDKAFGAGAKLFYEQPIKIVRGEGVYLFDESGRRYLDAYNNVPCVGHCHPEVVEAVCRQIGTLNVHSRYLHDGAVQLAERLVALHGTSIESVLFSCSGTEANECALRMARLMTGHSGFICSDRTYHGNTELVSTLTRVAEAGVVRETVRAFPFPDMYRPLKEGLSEAALCDLYLEKVERAIRELQNSGQGVAAIIACSIFANEGLPSIPSGFMSRAAELVRKAGGLFIADEIQSGYVRTGRWWGYEATGFTPDIVVTGKPMGNGVPLSATAASREMIDNFRAKTGHFSTFAASPLQAAAGLAVLNVIEKEGLRECAEKFGEAFQQLLAESTANTSFVGEVRGKGLYLCVDIVQPGTKTPDRAMAWKISEELKDRGVLTANAGAYSNIVKIRPPLTFCQPHINEFLDAWSEVMDVLDE